MMTQSCGISPYVRKLVPKVHTVSYVIMPYPAAAAA